ncbi:MAG: DUF6518 family protein [Solirubrobacterales bacterium]
MVDVVRKPWQDLRWAQILAATLLVGVSVGLAGRATDHTDSAIVSWLGVIGAPWLIAAFLTGAMIGESRSAAIAGACSQALAVAVYYASMYKIEHGTTARYAFVMTIGWSGFAALLGASMAYVGALTRARSARVRASALAVLAGLLIGEALYGFSVWTNKAAQTVVTAELIAGVAALAVFAPRGQLRRAVLVAIAVAAVAVCVETGVTDFMIRAGWAGARHG